MQACCPLENTPKDLPLQLAVPSWHNCASMMASASCQLGFCCRLPFLVHYGGSVHANKLSKHLPRV